jgi:hypothetical protein
VASNTNYLKLEKFRKFATNFIKNPDKFQINNISKNLLFIHFITNTFMFSKSTKFLFSSLVLTVSILTFSLPQISVKASTVPEFIIVTHQNGVNIRDKDCKIVDTANYGQVLNYNDENISNEHMNTFSLSCNVGGEKLKMVAYGTGKTNMFVAYKYTQMVNTNFSSFTIQNKVKLNNYMGSVVNLRDDKCQRIMTLPNGTYSENISVASNTQIPKIVCKADGEFYLMIPFVYKGQIYRVAQSLTMFE